MRPGLIRRKVKQGHKFKTEAAIGLSVSECAGVH